MAHTKKSNGHIGNVASYSGKAPVVDHASTKGAKPIPGLKVQDLTKGVRVGPSK